MNPRNRTRRKIQGDPLWRKTVKMRSKTGGRVVDLVLSPRNLLSQVIKGHSSASTVRGKGVCTVSSPCRRTSSVRFRFLVTV